MITLRQGDKLPTVAIVQSFLNQHGHSDEFIVVDGIFGRKTKRAVEDFQSAHRLAVTGMVKDEAWNQIVGTAWQVVDSVDITNFDDPKSSREDLQLQPYGQGLVVNYGQSSGTPEVLRKIRSTASAGKVVLLRFHGHGGPGNMIVSAGGQPREGSSLASHYGPGFYAAMAHLKDIFAPFGSVELHGCRVALGHRGHSLMAGLANAMGVPVSASKAYQYGGGPTSFKFEGAVETICPGGKSLKGWAQAKCQQSLVPA